MALVGLRIGSSSVSRMPMQLGLPSTSFSKSFKTCYRYRSVYAELASSQRFYMLGSFQLKLSTSSLAKTNNIRCQLYKRCAPFSASVAKTSSTTLTKQQQSKKWRWKIIARIAFYLRIPFLVLSVYGIGYQQGIMDYSRDSEYMEEKLLETTLASVGCVSPEDRNEVLIAHEGEWGSLLSKFQAHHNKLHQISQDDEKFDEKQRRMIMMQNASVVGEKIVKVAQSYVKTKLTEAVKEATESLPPEVIEDESRLYQALLSLEDVQTWTKAQKHMEGPWKFVLIPTAVPNAFVSEILPHRIFITTSLFEKFIESQDELALVLGHEISHLILGHSSDQNAFQAAFRTIEILLLSLDPTEGLLSLLFMSSLASARDIIGAVYSRDNERCADELGIKLTAMACYDTRAASQVFYKMHMQNVESGKESSSESVGWGGLFSFLDSHPPSEERFRTLLEESSEENKEKYDESCCTGLKTIFWDAMKSGDEKRT